MADKNFVNTIGNTCGVFIERSLDSSRAILREMITRHDQMKAHADDGAISMMQGLRHTTLFLDQGASERAAGCTSQGEVAVHEQFVAEAVMSWIPFDVAGVIAHVIELVDKGSEAIMIAENVIHFAMRVAGRDFMQPVDGGFFCVFDAFQGSPAEIKEVAIQDQRLCFRGQCMHRFHMLIGIRPFSEEV